MTIFEYVSCVTLISIISNATFYQRNNISRSFLEIFFGILSMIYISSVYPFCEKPEKKFCINHYVVKIAKRVIIISEL